MTLGELGEGVPGDDVTTHHLHRGIVVSDLLPQDGTGEHRVEPGETITVKQETVFKNINIKVCLFIDL